MPCWKHVDLVSLEPQLNSRGWTLCLRRRWHSRQTDRTCQIQKRNPHLRGFEIADIVSAVLVGRFLNQGIR
jgi:hypothetical protein